MTDETENLVLDLLRGMRADATACRSEADKRRGDVEERLDAIETPLEGWRHVVVATTGSLVTDMKDRGTRIAALEGARA